MMKIEPKPLKKKKCRYKECKKEFIPFNSLEPYCSLDCKIKDTLLKVRKENNKAAKVEKREWIKTKKELKNKNKSHPDWLKELEKEINHIARIIDYGHPCISCGKYTGQMQGGHYHAVGQNTSIRFHLENIFQQNYYCNGHLHANKTKYSEGLTNTFGKEYQEYVEFDLVKMYPTLKLTIPELKEKIKICREIIKELPEGKVYKVNERIEMRKQLNERIGIYDNK